MRIFGLWGRDCGGTDYWWGYPTFPGIAGAIAHIQCKDVLITLLTYRRRVQHVVSSILKEVDTAA